VYVGRQEMVDGGKLRPGRPIPEKKKRLSEIPKKKDGRGGEKKNSMGRAN